MLLSNAIKKMGRAGWTVTGEPGKPFWTYEKDGYRIEIGCNPIQDDGTRDVVMIDARRKTDRDDIQSDYHAGTFCDSIAEALRFVERMKTY